MIALPFPVYFRSQIDEQTDPYDLEVRKFINEQQYNVVGITTRNQHFLIIIWKNSNNRSVEKSFTTEVKDGNISQYWNAAQAILAYTALLVQPPLMRKSFAVGIKRSLT